MMLPTELYTDSLNRLPQSGQHIIGLQTPDAIVVYQAYKPSIAQYAVEHQSLGGADFSYNRMSWIKPNFLWMMYRCGWAQKENQERVLALWIKKDFFKQIISNAAASSFKADEYSSHEAWRADLDLKEVRLQWDPDHDPHGNKLERRAIQLGLKGNILEELGKNQIIHIEDITPFVTEQKQVLDANGLNALKIPVETILDI